MATIKPRGQAVKNLKQCIKKIPTTKRINPSEFHNVCQSIKVDIEFATEGLEEIKFCLRENGQSNKADAIGKLYNQLLSSVSTEYHKRSDGLAPMYLELSSAKKNAAILLAELKKIKLAETEQNGTLSKWRKIITWFKKHPHNYSLTVGVIALISFLVMGLFKTQWRNWCWGTAGIALFVLILSLLGGRSR